MYVVQVWYYMSITSRIGQVAQRRFDRVSPLSFQHSLAQTFGLTISCHPLHLRRIPPRLATAENVSSTANLRPKPFILTEIRAGSHTPSALAGVALSADGSRLLRNCDSLLRPILITMQTRQMKYPAWAWSCRDVPQRWRKGCLQIGT